MTAYLSGKITGDPNYIVKFAEAEAKLKSLGMKVLNPAMLPEGMRKSAYMPICLAMIDAADIVVLLEDFKESAGAKIEGEYSAYQGINRVHINSPLLTEKGLPELKALINKLKLMNRL